MENFKFNVGQTVTSPYFLGGVAIGSGIIAGVWLWAKNRKKSDKECELEKLKEENAEKERQREHEREIEKIKAQEKADEIESAEKTKRENARQAEETKRAEIAAKEKEDIRNWELNAPSGYWDWKTAEAQAKGMKESAAKNAELQRELAKIEAEKAKKVAEIAGKAKSDQFNANARMVRAVADGAANIFGDKSKNSIADGLNFNLEL